MFASPEYQALKVGGQASGGQGATFTGGVFIIGVNHNDGQTRQVNLYIAAYRRRS